MMHDHKCQCPDCDEARGETAEPPQPCQHECGNDGDHKVCVCVNCGHRAVNGSRWAEPAPPAAPPLSVQVDDLQTENVELLAENTRLEAENAQLRQLIQDQAWPEPLKPGERQKLESKLAAVRRELEDSHTPTCNMNKHAVGHGIGCSCAVLPKVEVAALRAENQRLRAALATGNTQKSGESSHGE